MKIEILCGSVANAHGVFLKGAIMDGPANDCRPLIDAGLAREVLADEPAKAAPKPKKGA